MRCEPAEIEVYRKDTWAATLQHFRKSVQILHDFRKTWSLRIVSLVVIQQAWLTADIPVRSCGQNAEQWHATLSSSPETPVCSTSDTSRRVRTDSSPHALLEKCFRCLIGGSANIPLARMMLLRLSRASKELKVELPRSILLISTTYDD